MTETARELLSALIDGEASEIEIHRLLRQLGEDDSLVEAWVSYQETRRVLRTPSNNEVESVVHLSIQQHLKLRRRISQAIEKDIFYSEDSNSSGSALPRVVTRPVAALAMAAAVLVAVFIGVQVNTPGGNDIVVESAAPGVQTIDSQANPRIRQPQLVATQAFPTEFNQRNEPIADDLELRELDEEGRRRLRAYLNQHDRMARMKPNTSLVTYPNQSGN